MKVITWAAFAWSLNLFISLQAFASTTLEISLEDRIERSKAVAIVEFLADAPFRNPEDARIYTRSFLRVEEALKGTFPETISIVHRGGMLDDGGEINGFSPSFSDGSYLIFLTVNEHGNLQAVDGAASVFPLGGARQGFVEEVRETLRLHPQPGPDLNCFATVAPMVSEKTVKAQILQSNVTGLIVDANNVASRFLQADRGEPIPYLVDADHLPNGMSQQQALTAVENALQAWADVTSLNFRFEGIESFGMAADKVDIDDGRFRIQLHDHYGSITSSSVLGVGGAAVIPSSGDNWGAGGNVKGNEFNKSTRGYVVLKHTSPAMEDLVTFEEALCHEIGHVLSMAHTSTNPNESDAQIRDSIMFFQAHKDGRGATLGEVDPPTIQQAYPADNLPPYSFDRILDAVHSPYSLGGDGINELELKGHDHDGDPLTIESGDIFNGVGTFSLAGNVLKHTPTGNFGPDLEPEENNFFARYQARFSDGVNSSPPIRVYIYRSLADSYPVGSPDGIPDSWMVQRFGHANPAMGTKRGANDDLDEDGFTTWQEWLLDSDPQDPGSNLSLVADTGGALEWEAKPFSHYEIQRTSDFEVWELFRATTTDAGTASISLQEDELTGHDFFRVFKVR